MILKLCLTLAVIAVGCTNIWAQGYSTTEAPNTTSAPHENGSIPDIGQLEERKLGEDEPDDPAGKDHDFDNRILNHGDKPRTSATAAEASSLFQQEKSRLVQEAYNDGDLEGARQIQTASVSYAATYYNYWDYYRYYDRCCPRSQNYGCRSNRNLRLPCFAHCENGRREWCCPLWNHYVINCNCNSCAVLGHPFVSIGKCHRRYSNRVVVAVCLGADGRRIVRRIPLSLPSSCYCVARKPDCCS